MINRADVSRSLIGVWELLLDRPGAVNLFDATVEGFWKSFQSIVLVAPIYALLILLDEQAFASFSDPADLAHFDPATYFVARLLTLGLDWITLPIVLAPLAPYLGIQRGYSAYIVIRNWSTLFTLLPYGIASVLEATGLVRGAATLVPEGIALAVAVRISYIAARRALGVPIDVAIGFVVLDFLISLGLSFGIAYLFGIAVGPGG